MARLGTLALGLVKGTWTEVRKGSQNSLHQAGRHSLGFHVKECFHGFLEACMDKNKALCGVWLEAGLLPPKSIKEHFERGHRGAKERGRALRLVGLKPPPSEKQTNNATRQRLLQRASFKCQPPSITHWRALKLRT